VVHVPIENDNPVDAVHRAGVPRRKRDVVEQAEPHAVPGAGVMTRRPHERRGHRRLAAQHRVHGHARAAGREPRHVVGRGRHRRVGVQGASAGRGGADD
jgi:hypothetical protein